MSKPLQLLFDNNELTCFTDKPFGTSLFPVSLVPSKAVYFSINPLKLDRRDANVTAYRNILCEFDAGTTDEQLNAITESNLPFALITFSGSKSLHAIISLKMPLKDRAQYDYVTRLVYAKFKPGVLDISCKNPSRLSRLPGAIRPETGLVQKVVAIGQRVSQADLADILGIENLEAPTKPKAPVSNTLKLLPAGTHFFLNYGAPAGMWNRQLFLAALNMKRASYTEDEIFSKLESVTGQLDTRDLKTIRSALRSANEQR